MLAQQWSMRRAHVQTLSFPSSNYSKWKQSEHVTRNQSTLCRVIRLILNKRHKPKKNNETGRNEECTYFWWRNNYY